MVIIMKNSKLSYIVYPSQVEKQVEVTTKNYGSFVFIRKHGEKTFYAYRRIGLVTNQQWFVETRLPAEVFNDYIRNGKVAELLAK